MKVTIQPGNRHPWLLYRPGGGFLGGNTPLLISGTFEIRQAPSPDQTPDPKTGGQREPWYVFTCGDAVAGAACGYFQMYAEETLGILPHTPTGADRLIISDDEGRPVATDSHPSPVLQEAEKL